MIEKVFFSSILSGTQRCLLSFTCRCSVKEAKQGKRGAQQQIPHTWGADEHVLATLTWAGAGYQSQTKAPLLCQK